MDRNKQRSWLARLRQLPQEAGQAITTQFHRIPQKLRFLLISALFTALTTLLVSHFPLFIASPYRIGDIVTADVIVPEQMIAREQARAAETGTPFRREAVLLREGERVTAEELPRLEAVRRFQLAQRRPAHLIGLLALIGFLFFALYKSALANQSSRLGPRTAYWVASTALVLQTALVRVGLFGAAVLTGRPETSGLGEMLEYQFAIPFAACALVLSLLVSSEVALVAALMSALLIGVMSPHGLPIAAYALAGSVTAIYAVQRYRTRSAIMWAGLAAGGVNVLMGFAALLLAGHPWDGSRAFGGAVLGLIGALLAAAMASLAIPAYESAFDILTDMKLLELSNADNPLLRRLAIETPGTSHHSFMVGLLAEEAAKAIGGNPLLARVGCLYHDIGKLAAPPMYIENQKGGPNAHDRVAPTDSVRIITGHVRRGIEMALEHKLPSRIIDFIPQHHGTRVLAFFYHKAKAQAEARGETVNMDDFRYPGPKPQSKEAVILMLADGAEASVRSLEDKSPENIRAIIKKIADTVIADGQLDESDITMRELTTIRESLVNTLINVHHQRISYPGFNPPSQKAAPVEMAAEPLPATRSASAAS